MRKPVAAAIGSAAAGVTISRPPSSTNWTLPPALNPSFQRSCREIKIWPFAEIWDTGMENVSCYLLCIPINTDRIHFYYQGPFCWTTRWIGSTCVLSSLRSVVQRMEVPVFFNNELEC